MKLWQEILKKYTQKEIEDKEFIDFLKSECYLALEKIRSILQDEALDDCDCFERIEEIVLAFEGIGSSCGCRHDF